jgi:hypothetical protein
VPLWTPAAPGGRRLPEGVRFAIALPYALYWLALPPLVSDSASVPLLAVWIALSIALVPIIGFGSTGVAAAFSVFPIALWFVGFGATAPQVKDASAVALYGYLPDFEPDAGPVATCDSRAVIRLPFRVSYHCRAGYCAKHNRPVFTIGVRVTQYPLLRRWTYSLPPSVPHPTPGASYPTPGHYPSHGSVNPHEVSPVDCSAVGY